MRLLFSVFIFYKKLLVPLITLSALVGIFSISAAGFFTLKGAGITYILFTPLFLYFIYDIRNPNEYYFYYNLGLSRLSLWISALSISVIIGFILIII